MKSTKMYLSVSCILGMMIVFAILSIVYFNSQNASAEAKRPPGYGLNKIAIKIKNNLIKGIAPEELRKKDREEITNAEIKQKLDSAMEGTNLELIPYDMEQPNPEWTIYLLLVKQGHGIGSVFVPEGTPIHNLKRDTAAMSITLTHHDKFVMNHIKAIPIDGVTDPEPIIVDMIEVVANVIQQKVKNKDATIIVTDKSTIAK